MYVTRAQVSLDAIATNLEAVRERVGSDRLVLAAVKANGYGHGAVPIAQMIEQRRVADWLGVATVEEALELREAGITLPILKFTPTRGRDEVEAAVASEIVLPVADQVGIELVASVAQAQGRTVPVHLKVDTGMRRVGCEPADAPRLAQLIDESPGLHLQGVFSHLPISDSPAGDDFTRAQIQLFTDTARQIERLRGPIPIKHLANSGGVLAHPGSWFDLVRPGVMIYGNYPDDDVPRTVDLTPALRWTTEVMFVKQVKAGESVGYGRTWVAPQDTWIATLPVGYGDGYSRRLSNRGRVLIDGESYPIVGRVCMDQTMVDLGPQTDVVVGDQVVLIGRSHGEEIKVSEVADQLGTITYEVTCLITGRVKRSY